MSADRRRCPGDRKHVPTGGRAGAHSPCMLMPVAIVTFGAADRPVECLIGLQSAMARVAAEISRVPDFLMSRLSRCRRALDVARPGGSALTQH